MIHDLPPIATGQQQNNEAMRLPDNFCYSLGLFQLVEYFYHVRLTIVSFSMTCILTQDKATQDTSLQSYTLPWGRDGDSMVVQVMPSQTQDGLTFNVSCFRKPSKEVGQPRWMDHLNSRLTSQAQVTQNGSHTFENQGNVTS